jgi:hypothetical protein
MPFSKQLRRSTAPATGINPGAATGARIDAVVKSREASRKSS